MFPLFCNSNLSKFNFYLLSHQQSFNHSSQKKKYSVSSRHLPLLGKKKGEDDHVLRGDVDGGNGSDDDDRTKVQEGNRTSTITQFTDWPEAEELTPA